MNKNMMTVKRSVAYLLLAVLVLSLFGRFTATTASAKELSKKACAKKITTLTEEVATLKAQYKAQLKKEKGTTAAEGTTLKSAKIKAKYDKKKAALKVYQKAAKSEPKVEDIELYVGDTLEQKDYLTIKNSTKYTTFKVTLDTNDYITIDEKGVLTAVAPGTTKLTVKCVQSGKTAKCKIVVLSEDDDEEYDESDEGEDELFESDYTDDDEDFDDDDGDE